MSCLLVLGRTCAQAEDEDQELQQRKRRPQALHLAHQAHRTCQELTLNVAFARRCHTGAGGGGSLHEGTRCKMRACALDTAVRSVLRI